MNALQAKLDLFWSFLFLRRRSRFVAYGVPSLIAIGVLGLAGLLRVVSGIYFPSTVVFGVVLISVAASPGVGIGLALILALVADFVFLPPVGVIFGDVEAFEHFLVLMGVSVLVNLLVGSFRRSYFEALHAKAEAKEAYRLALNTAAEMERLLGFVSHDLKNPLSAAKLASQLLDRSGLSATQQVPNARIQQSVDRAVGMIDTLLEAKFSRKGRLAGIHLAPVDLAAVVRATGEGLRALYGNRVVVRAEEKLDGVFSGEGVRRALENLVTNAVKYGAKETPIVIHLSREEKCAVVSVHNLGRAIAATDQAQLFDRFYRVQAAEGEKVSGWGIGLAFVKELARAHGGEVGLTSEEGKGTTFWMRLPLGNSPA